MKQDRTNPFPGLRPFDVDEDELFFGRSHQTDELLSRLRQSRFTAVIGTSGSGKSSLVRAGLLPALKRGLMAAAGSRWRVALFRPINDPIGNLTRALKREGVFVDAIADDQQLSFIDSTLRSSSLGLVELLRQSRMKADENLLIVVDQFEELFRFEETFTCENPADEALAFVKLLLAATTRQREVPIYLVLTMRSDYLGESARFRGLPEAINEGQYLVPRMNDDERRQAITAPVAVAKGQISEPLVNRLLNDVGDDPGKLPLLQHALMRTWENWENDGRAGGAPLSISNYAAIGGLSGSLSKHANDIYDELSEGQQLVAERVFKALTAKGPDGRGVRTPRTFGELCAIATVAGSSAKTIEPDVRAVIDSFRGEGRSFLMPPPRDVENPDRIIPLTADTLIDISHESLILGWDRLQQWVEDEADAARMYQRLSEHAVLFDKGIEKRLSPPALPVFLRWRDETHPNTAWGRRYFNPAWSSLFKEGGSKTSEYDTEFDRADAFLDESNDAYEAELAVKEKAAKQRVRRLVYIAVSFALLFLLATVFAGVAVAQWRKAQSALQRAEAAEAVTKQQKEEAERQRALAVEGRLEAEKQSALAEAQANEAVRQKADAVTQRELARRAESQAVAAKAEAVKDRNAAEMSAQVASVAQKKAQDALAEAQTSKEEALTQKEEAETLRDLAESATATANEQKQRATEQRIRANSEFQKADETLITLRNIDNQTRHLNAINRKNDPISTAVFADSEHAFISSGNDAALFERRSGSWEFKESDFRDVPRLVYKLQTESNLAAHMQDVLPSETEDRIGKFGGAEKPDQSLITSLVSGFNTALKNSTLYKKSAFRYVKLRPETQALLDKFNQDQGSVNLAQLNRMLLEDAYPLEIAQVNHFNEAQKFPSHYVFALDTNFKRVAAKSQDREIDIFDSAGKQIGTKTNDYLFIDSVDFSPQGNYIWSLAREDVEKRENYQILIWKNDEKDDEPRRLDFTKPINRAVMNHNETQIAINFSSSTEIQLWDIKNKTKIRSLTGTEKLSAGDFLPTNDSGNAEKTDLITHIAYSNDGKYIVATFKNHRNLRLWDATTGELLHDMDGHHCQVNSAEFSNDDTLIVSAGEDGAAFVWDRKSGRVKHELRGHLGLMIRHVRKGFRAWFPPIPFPLDLDLQSREGAFVPLNSAKFNHDGTKVVTASVDGRIALWTWKKNDPFAVKSLELKGYTGSVLNAEFSPDDEFVIAGGQDGAARIWRVPKPLSDKSPAAKSCKDASEIRSAKHDSDMQ